MDSFRKMVGDNIRRARKTKSWTQTQLADAAGVSLRGLQDIEHGKKMPREVTLKAIAGALNTTDQAILSGSYATTFKSRSPAAEIESKSDLILRIIGLLGSLDESELRTILATVEASPSSRSTARRAVSK